MKFKYIKNTAIALAITTSMATVASEETTNSTQQLVKSELEISESAYIQGLITTELIRGWILDGAKSAIKGGAKDFISNLLFGGGEAGPQIVRLHAEDLQKIENLVFGVIINDAVHDAKSQLASFSNTFDYYQDSLSGSNFDPSILTSLLFYVNALREHRAYDSSYNSNAYALTSSYSLIATLNLAVLTERHVKGYVSEAFVKSQASAMASKLASLGAKVDAKSYSMGGVQTFGSRCFGGRSVPALSAAAEQEQPDNSIMAPLDCMVGASFPGKPTKRWNATDIGLRRAEDLAYEYLSAMRAEYRKEIKGEDFESVISKLRNL
ncbi:hypothetical protein HG263_00970 [Pseudoalteromonas sp. JBTF-M23]|uniref:Uncharacterized protein n=1 Tax=Pseudoalteromonas caenipelagi TaxID=2726988 RepID=A0A849V912_9GAMM|nr:hypothetical protein [Pseudoalteromonas caenipelagi]NOU49123.1 hypothetical protein [Pseudoalteromonas caenipelagi]